jgi:hypothetical protein
VVEASWGPSTGGVTGTAIGTKLTLVSIIFGMAGVTILGGSLHIGDTSVVGMASHTVQREVLPGQLEGDFGVVEIVTIGIDAIVASQAVITIRLDMCGHEIGLDLLVASHADRLVKFSISVDVAGLARKRRTIRLALVGVKRIAKYLVLNICHRHVGQWGIRAAVIGVTGAAWRARFLLHLVAVQGGWILQLGSDIRMANHTALSHCSRLPEK